MQHPVTNNIWYDLKTNMRRVDVQYDTFRDIFRTKKQISARLADIWEFFGFVFLN